ncbi:ferrochelatase [Planctomycetota bacterium]
MTDSTEIEYDAILFVSFGGPEGPDDVMPFLENVLRGRSVPRERMLEVAEHYNHFGGVSPINSQNRALISELENLLAEEGPKLPIYFGNRNWHPMLTDAVQQMADDGIKRALAFFTSAFSSYSGCRQYREDIQKAQEAVGELAPPIDKLRVYFNHPGFIEPMVENVRAAIQTLPEEVRSSVHVAFTAHSVPQAMAGGSNYEMQLAEASEIIAKHAGLADWKLVYQSRSGPPSQRWLEPDICDHIANEKKERDINAIVVAPIGFISDHMEVLFDLDTEAKEICESLEIPFARAATVGTHPKFVRAIRDLIVERLSDAPTRLALGCMGPSHDICPTDCCTYARPTRPVR